MGCGWSRECPRRSSQLFILNMRCLLYFIQLVVKCPLVRFIKGTDEAVFQFNNIYCFLWPFSYRRMVFKAMTDIDFNWLNFVINPGLPLVVKIFYILSKYRN